MQAPMLETRVSMVDRSTDIRCRSPSNQSPEKSDFEKEDHDNGDSVPPNNIRKFRI